MVSGIELLIKKFEGFLDWSKLYSSTCDFIEELTRSYESAKEESTDLHRELEAAFCLLIIKDYVKHKMGALTDSRCWTDSHVFVEFHETISNLHNSLHKGTAEEVFFRHYEKECSRTIAGKMEKLVLQTIKQHPDILSCPVEEEEHEKVGDDCPFCNGLRFATAEEIVKGYKTVRTRKKYEDLLYLLNLDILYSARKLIAKKKRESKSPKHE